MRDEAAAILGPVGKGGTMTREEAAQIWKDARHVYAQSRLPDVRRAAKRIALKIEVCFDALGTPSAETWDI